MSAEGDGTREVKIIHKIFLLSNPFLPLSLPISFHPLAIPFLGTIRTIGVE